MEKLNARGVTEAEPLSITSKTITTGTVMRRVMQTERSTGSILDASSMWFPPTCKTPRYRLYHHPGLLQVLVPSVLIPPREAIPRKIGQELKVGSLFICRSQLMIIRQLAKIRLLYGLQVRIWFDYDYLQIDLNSQFTIEISSVSHCGILTFYIRLWFVTWLAILVVDSRLGFGSIYCICDLLSLNPTFGKSDISSCELSKATF